MLPTPRDGRFGLTTLTGHVLRDVVTAVRFETADMREVIHRLRRVRSCDTKMFVDEGYRLVITGDCLCRDFFQDMLFEADRFLQRRGARPLRNPPGAVRIHVRTRAHDWTRQLRGERGAQVRTDRIRDGAIAEQLRDPYDRALLEFVVQEAGSLSPLGSEVDLFRRLAVLAAAEFGGGPEEHLPRVVAGLPRVEAAARSGRRVRACSGSAELITWWERYVERPLGRRERPDNVPLESSAAVPSPRRVDGDPEAVAVEMVLDVAVGMADASRAAALSAAIEMMVLNELLPEADARRFLGDPGRVREAVAQIDLLLAA